MSVVINFITKLDDRGVNSAQKRLARFGAGAKGFAGSYAAEMVRAGDSLQRFGNRAAKAGDTFSMRFSLPVIAAGGLVTKMAMDEQQEMALLDKALRNNVQATDEQVAAVERWITATQNATGVADGELRPAMATLLTATKDTGKAQELMAKALDIAAAKGKPVGDVATALMKAYNGSTGALSRLGLKTKDATGETMTFDQVMKGAARTFGGSAAKAADTAAGRMEILQAKLADTGEEVGTGLIPAVEAGGEAIGNLAERFNSLPPATQGFIAKAVLATAVMGPLLSVGGRFAAVGGRMYKAAGNIGLAFGKNAKDTPLYARAIAGATKRVGSLAKSVGSAAAALGKHAAASVLAAAKTAAHTAVTLAAKAAQVAVTGATKAMAAAQWLVNAAMSANPVGLVVLAIAGLVAGLVIAYKKSETFRRIVNAAWGAIKKAAVTVFNFVADFVRAWVVRVRIALAGVVAIARWVVDKFVAIKDGVVSAISRVISYVSGIGSRIKTAVGNLGSTLYGAGGDLLRGLWNGMKAMGGWLKDKFTGFFKDMIPGWAKEALGIDSPSKVFAEIGRQTAAGLIAGIDASRGRVASSTRGLMAAASGTASIDASGGFAPAFAAGGRGGGLVIRATFNVSVNGSGMSRSEVTSAVRFGVDPALQRLAQELKAL